MTPPSNVGRDIKEKRLHYAWVVAGLTFITLLLSAAIRSVPSVLIVSWEEEFGWSRATISFAISIGLLLFGLIGPFAAGLINRYGAKAVMIVAFVFTSCGALLSVFMTAAWQLIVLWGFVTGIGTGLAALVLGTAVVNRWFHTRRGLILGLLTASTATGQLIFLPVLAHFVETEGWRVSVLIMLSSTVLFLPFIILWMKDDPAQMGLRPYGLPKGEAHTRPSILNPVRQALDALRAGLRSRDFWLLAGSFFICGASTNGLIGTHMIPACRDHGMGEVQAAGLLVIMGLFDLVGTTASGWLSDRFNHRHLLSAYYGFRGLSLIFLPHGFESESGLNIFAVFYGLDWIATVPPTVGLTTAVFGREKATLMFGWIIAAHQIGAACAASLAGLLRVVQGSYNDSFRIAGILCLLTAVAVLYIARNGRSETAIEKRAA